MKNYVKAFIAGMTFPALFLSIMYTWAYLAGFSVFVDYPLQFIPLWLPWIFGVWNCINVALGKELPVKGGNRYWILGISLGLIVATFGITVVELPVLLGFPGGTEFLPIFFVPVVYGLIWRYVVMWLNKLLQVKV